MEQQKCHVFRPSRSRAAKRQTVEELTGVDVSLDLRKAAFRSAWRQQEDQFDTLTQNLNNPILKDIVEYFQKTPTQSTLQATLPTALIVTGTTGASNDVLFNQLHSSLIRDETCCFVSLSAADAPNLKTLLKNLIRRATDNDTSASDEADFVHTEATSYGRLLNYDLDILQHWCNLRPQKHIVVCLQDAESFDPALLTDVLMLLKSWLDRISFKLVLGIATSLELFQDRLPRQALRCIRGRLFGTIMPEDALEAIFQESVTAEKCTVRLGPVLVADFMQRQHDHMQSVEDFKQVLKYAYMSHFFADSVSIFLIDNVGPEQISEAHFEAVRNLSSFRAHVESLLKQDDIQAARCLVESDSALLQSIRIYAEQGRRTVIWSMGACAVIKAIRSTVREQEAVPFSALYARSLSGTLQNSALLKETLMIARVSSSTTILHLLTKITEILIVMPPANLDVSPEDFYDLQNELQTLMEEHGELNGNDVDSNTDLPNTSKPQPTSTQSLGAGNLPKTSAQARFQELTVVFVERLASYFQLALVSIDNIFLNEILFYDLRSPHRDVFTPKPRIAFERALSAPQDYLGCDCCTRALSATQPATAILYQLYLESGALVNAFDLWSAFKAVVTEQQPDERLVMALFFRGLAELRHMGLIKQSRRRTDCLAKMAWKGL